MVCGNRMSGPYLESKFPYIADEVNKRLSPAVPPADGWKQIGDKWYYYEKGQPVKNAWRKITGSAGTFWYSFDADGVMRPVCGRLATKSTVLMIRLLRVNRGCVDCYRQGRRCAVVISIPDIVGRKYWESPTSRTNKKLTNRLNT